MQQLKTDKPPIEKLTDQEVYEKLWTSKESLRAQLLQVLKSLEESDLKHKAIALAKEIPKQVTSEANFTKLCQQIRQTLQQISLMLRHLPSRRICIPSFCDILWLYGYIETYFTPCKEYTKVVGDEVSIRKCDVRGDSSNQRVLYANEQEKTIYKGRKEYDNAYVWGQLVGWYKQTVGKPNASLSADRRGTLSMPDLESFILNERN